MPYTYTTIDAAEAALKTAEADVLADMGEDAVEAGWYDIVQSVAFECTPEVARELRRTRL